VELSMAVSLLAPCETQGEMRGQVTGLAYNSKTVESAQLFFCLRGNFADGHDFASEATDNGAIALVVEAFLPLSIPQIKVADARAALSQVGRQYYGDPAGRLGMVGVTGTNGKTTTTFYIRSIFQHAGRQTGLLGTVYNQFGGAPLPSQLTTPESVDLWALLHRAVADQCDWVAMEVSSHALSMHRVDPADFDLAVVLNVTRDHFDYHKTFEHYLQAKARLVQGLAPGSRGGRPKAALLNADDPHAAAMAAGCDVPVFTFGLQQPADVRATEVHAGPAGSDFTLHLPGATPTPVHLPMPGLFNVSNALAAAGVAWVAGVPLSDIAGGLATCRHVPGRTEVVDEGQAFTVLVDFAHNPDALAKICSLRPEREGARTIVVFGAEGGKDKGKRPEMGRAARQADYAIVTSDNMPKEDPADVARQVADGLQGHPHEICLDRREAIGRALAMAAPGDVVIIAGKGHEQTWVYEGRRIPFDDRVVARETLKALRNASVPNG
jgi:UDP-N-acetylmuramoyl-L-alanyl-D-glutamate--2,6-diaminopimelate ligase